MSGFFGTNPGDNGVVGQTNSDANAGVNGRNDGKGFGVFGFSHGGAGVEGHSDAETGVVGFCTGGTGVRGTGRTGVAGQTNSDTDAGVNGRNDGRGFGVFGFSARGAGVEGHSTDGSGVEGFSQNGLAGHFLGNVEVTGDIRLVNAADCAEDFAIVQDTRVEPGTVMVLGDSGRLEVSRVAFDKRVAGVISGGGNYKPGIVLDRQEPQPDRKPIALLGKVYCKVDAQYSAVEVGDLLTTSPTAGHAMRADDPFKAFGAVIGKALWPLASGQALIPILIALQ